MFIDVCYPNNNEKEFIEIAKKIGTKGLIFLYNQKKKINVQKTNADFCLYYATYDKKDNSVLFFDKNLNQKNTKRKNVIYFFEGPFEGKKNFHVPMKEFTQVFIKDIVNNDKFIGVSCSYFLNSTKNDDFEKLTYFFTLINKYNVNIFLGSFAKKPFDLRPLSHLVLFVKKFRFLDKNLKLEKFCLACKYLN